MNAVVASKQVREARIEAVIIGVDGKPKKDLGVVAYYHRNPLKRLWWHLKKGVQTWLR